jgi:Flp pilus assembly protein CpaB
MRRKPVRRAGVALTLRRRPRLRGALVAAVALLCGAAVAATVQQAEDARDAWGEATRVLIASEDLDAGTRLTTGNTRVAAHPAPLVADGALTGVPADARVAAPVLEGEVVRAERLAPAGASPVAARLPAGTRAMAIPVEVGTTPPLRVGDHVEVLVALSPESSAGGPPGFSLVEDAPVVEVTDAAVTIAVARDVAPRLAAAFGRGAVTLALLGA